MATESHSSHDTAVVPSIARNYSKIKSPTDPRGKDRLSQRLVHDSWRKEKVSTKRSDDLERGLNSSVKLWRREMARGTPNIPSPVDNTVLHRRKLVLWTPD